jgi:AbrB family looped-hinge helix DNA binding protein
MYISTVTKQGQISIPAKLRKKLNLNKRQVWISESEGKVIIEPVVDLLDLAGSLHHKALKNKPIDEIIALEKKAVEDAIVERYLKSLPNNLKRGVKAKINENLSR